MYCQYMVLYLPRKVIIIIHIVLPRYQIITSASLLEKSFSSWYIPSTCWLRFDWFATPIILILYSLIHDIVSPSENTDLSMILPRKLISHVKCEMSDCNGSTDCSCDSLSLIKPNKYMLQKHSFALWSYHGICLSLNLWKLDSSFIRNLPFLGIIKRLKNFRSWTFINDNTFSLINNRNMFLFWKHYITDYSSSYSVYAITFNFAA